MIADIPSMNGTGKNRNITNSRQEIQKQNSLKKAGNPPGIIPPLASIFLQITLSSPFPVPICVMELTMFVSEPDSEFLKDYLYHSIGKTSEPICPIVLILYYIHSSTIPASPSSKKMYRAISITIDKKIL